MKPAGYENPFLGYLIYIECTSMLLAKMIPSALVKKKCFQCSQCPPYVQITKSSPVPELQLHFPKQAYHGIPAKCAVYSRMKEQSLYKGQLRRSPSLNFNFTTNKPRL